MYPYVFTMYLLVAVVPSYYTSLARMAPFFGSDLPGWLSDLCHSLYGWLTVAVAFKVSIPDITGYQNVKVTHY